MSWCDIKERMNRRSSRLGMAVLVVGLLGGTSAAAILSEPDERVSVGHLEVAPDLSEARIALASSAPLRATGPNGPLEIRDEVLRVPLDFTAEGQQIVRVVFEPVPSTPIGTLRKLALGDRLGSIEIKYYPRSLYNTLGSPQQGTLLMFTTLPRLGEPRLGEGFGAKVDPRESLVVKGDGWAEARRAGQVPDSAVSFDEQIRRLYLRFNELNDPAVGRLCDESLPGIDTYHSMASGSCFVWCTGYSQIMRDFLRFGGMPARLINLTAQSTVLPNEILVQSSEGHQTLEVWDGSNWVWIDGTLRVLRAVGADGRPLSTHEVILAVARPETRETLLFTRLDQTSGNWVTKRFRDQDEDFRIGLASTITPDKLISIPRDGRG
jgi:hypothetical protein